MSVFKTARGLVAGAPWLWVSDRRRAVAFLSSLAVLAGALIAFDVLPPWRGLPPPAAASETARVATGIAGARKAKADVVLFLGGSAMREFTPSTRRLSDALTAACRRPILVVNAGTSDQSLADGWGMADEIPHLKLIVAGMNYHRFEEGADRVAAAAQGFRTPFGDPPELRAVLAEAGQTRPLSLPTPRQTAWWIAQQAANGAPAPEGAFEGPANVYRAPALSRADKEAIVAQRISDRVALFDRSHGEATALWRRFVRRFATPSTKVLLLVLPESETSAPARRVFGQRFDADMAQIAKAGAGVQDWRDDHGLAEEDFYDQQHLLASGRAKLEPRLMSLLAGQLAGCTPS